MNTPCKVTTALLALCIGACLFITACGTPKSLGASLEAQKKLTSYHLTLKAPNKTAQQFVKMADGKMKRMKFDTGGGKTIYVNVDKGEMFMHDGGKGIALKMPMDPKKVEASAKPAGKITKDTPVKGSETIDGVECWVVEYENRGKKRRVWVGKKHGLPRKATVGKRETQFTYDKINAVPENVFDMPKDVRVMDFTRFQKGGAGS